jgi:FkbM family methyltransferase
MLHIDYLYKLKYEYNVNPKIIYDIGSNLLHWSKVAGSVWKNSKIYHIDGYSKLEQLYKKHNINYAIEVLGSENNKEVMFYQNTVNSGGCSCYELNYEKYPNELKYFKNQYYSEELKKTKTLDTLVEEKNWEFPDLIKMDVQGSELDIMMGASKVIQNCNHIILELQSQEFNRNAPMEQEVIQKMNEWGYDIKDRICVNPLQVDSDYYFVRRV